MSGAFQQSEKENNLVLVLLLLLLIFCFVVFPDLSFVVIFFGGLGYAVYSQNRIKSVLLTLLMLAIFFSYAFIAGLDEWPGVVPFFKTLIPIAPFLIPYCIAVFFAAVSHPNLIYKLSNYLVSIIMLIFMFIIFLSGIN